FQTLKQTIFGSLMRIFLPVRDLKYLRVLPCSNIVMNRNYGFRIGIFRSGTTAANYAAVTNAALTTNVHLEGNRVEGGEFGPTTSPRFVTLAYLMFVKNAVLISNDAFNCEYNLEW